MTGAEIQLWTAPTQVTVSDKESNPAEIASRALQLRSREQHQIASNFDAGNYEMASSFVWMRTMALLKKQLASLGIEFIGELLQRPDIDEYSDVSTAVSDAEAISLARDLGIITPTQTMRLLHSQQVVTHFAAIDNDPSIDEDEIMTQEEAVGCLRVCVQGVLGHETVSVAEDFKSFRSKLETETFSLQSPEIVKLFSSPYFFMRTAISILLSLFKTGKGAQLEHISRNASLIISKYWEQLKAPERWQIGQAYAQEFSEGRKESVKGLHAVLVSVSGFDYVPENLRSSTFVQVASSVVAAHQGMNNFYNEPAPMSELANLGTSIPNPALAKCMTAVLCVKLGNSYGTSHAAQEPANRVFNSLSKERWYYFFNELLGSDRVILSKLTDSQCQERWVSAVQSLELDAGKISDRDIKALLNATIRNERPRLTTVALTLLNNALGS